MRRASFFSLVGLALVACGGQSLDVGSKVTPTPPSEQPPVTSTDPNDVWLAFDTSTRTDDIYIVRADGSQLQHVDLGMDASSPAFAPNGKALAFAGPNGIWVRDLTRGTSQRVTSSSGSQITWSPDGKLLAFSRDQGIWLVGADGSGERPYIEGPPPGQPYYVSYDRPVFTGDGASLLFQGAGVVEIGAIGGSSVRDLISPVRSSTIVSIGTVSPDGSALLVVLVCSSHYPDFAYSIISVPEADAATPCSAGTTIAEDPLVQDYVAYAWSTNGLLAWSRNGTEGKIWVAPAKAGGTATAIVDPLQSLRGALLNGHLSWSAPGTVVR